MRLIKYFDCVFLIKNMVREVKRLLFRTKPSNQGIDLKSQLMEEACIARGIRYERISHHTIQAVIHDKAMLFTNMNGPSASVAVKHACDEKMVARGLLRKSKLSVPDSILCGVNDESAMRRFAEAHGFPLVVKPSNRARGYGVFTDIMDGKTLIKSIQKLKYMLGGHPHVKVIIEKQFQGDDFRFFIVDGHVVAVSHRIRPHVVGDGVSDIAGLIRAKNMVRKQNRYLKHYLIPQEKKKLERLYREGKDVHDVPGNGEYVFLRDQSNLSGGGDSVDVTDHASETFKRLALKAIASIPGMHYGGVDFITKDIRINPEDHEYVITEIEFSPGPISNFPIEGQPRDMAGPILDFYSKEEGPHAF
jgi:D-alanine-D-alanine ligase-like ATP-grasp enzyme